MQFTVNNQEYFLTFAEDEKRRFLIFPTATGMTHIPVYVDVTKWERIGDRERRTPRIQ